ncbi:unnamed protein product, partial [Notodromas monacha]
FGVISKLCEKCLMEIGYVAPEGIVESVFKRIVEEDARVNGETNLAGNSTMESDETESSGESSMASTIPATNSDSKPVSVTIETGHHHHSHEEATMSAAFVRIAGMFEPMLNAWRRRLRFWEKSAAIIDSPEHANMIDSFTEDEVTCLFCMESSKRP